MESVDALSIAKDKAAARSGLALEHADAVEAKRRKQSAEVGKLYAGLQSLANARVQIAGRRGELELSRGADYVLITARAMDPFVVDKSRFGEMNEIRYRKGKDVLEQWRGGCTRGVFWTQRGGHPRVDASDVNDAVRMVAEQVGAVLMLEE